MIGLFKSLFNYNFRNITTASKDGQPDRLHIATCAILLEMAKIDGEFSSSEKQDIINAFKNKYHLSDDEIKALIDASEEELEGSIDLWQFTNWINKICTPEEKFRIIETIWQVAYADGRLDSHEDYLIHKLAELLNISHRDLIEAKLKVLQRIQCDSGK
jgi:uncharacterized tellurite resistance protein B-like protein